MLEAEVRLSAAEAPTPLPRAAMTVVVISPASDVKAIASVRLRLECR